MKKYILLVVFATVFSFVNAQIEWQTVNVNAGTANLTDISFPNDSVGYVVGNDGTTNYIMKTNDYGTTWTNVATNDVVEMVRTIDFYDAENGLAGGENGGLYKTDDGGASWSSVPTGTNVNFIDVSYPKDKVAYLCSSDGRFFSFNGFGLLSSTIHTPDDFVKVQFVSDKKGFVVAMQGNVWMTADGGTTWDTIKTDQQLLKSAFFQNENTGYLVGPRGKMEYTINAGGMWLEATLNIHETVQFNDVYFLNTSFGVMAGNKGTIIRTLDRGTNWIDEPTNTTEHINVLTFPSFNYGYAAGENGVVLKRLDKSSIAEKSNLKIQSFPNPAQDVIYLAHNYNALDVRIYDVNGKLMLEELDFTSQQIKLDDFQPGIYFMMISNPEGSYYQKLIVE
jgi:photosystem II stability/assembly factor-like uncharacterized protein